ncbi:MAG: hypothetical protein B6D55_07725 [Candidatus Omnitrophica bacterium 4484_70.2]|nr:MAG: hypothetical protein B6D55_07725 [Candidatus Omnitrophica bacterium 4484_70.2]
MIEDIFVLGKAYCNLKGEPEFLENPNTNYALIIELERKENKLNFQGVKIEKVKEDWKKYMYRKGPSNQYDFTPSSRLRETDKTINRIIKWTKDNEKIIPNLRNVLETSKEIIKKEIDKSVKESRSRSFLITITIDGKYLSEILPREFVKNKVIERFGKYENYSSKGEGKCMLCGYEGKVFGLTLPEIGFQFYNVDKPGFAPNFRQEWSYRQIPMCENCSIILISGKNFLDKYLKFEKTGAGFSFYIIPSFLFKQQSSVEEFIKKVKIWRESPEKDIGEAVKSIISNEDRLYNIIENESDSLRLNFLFFIEQQKRFLILNYISDVRPSWLKKIYGAQIEILRESIFSEEIIQRIFGSKKKGNFFTRFFKTDNSGYIGNISWWIAFLKNLFYFEQKNKKSKIIPKEYIQIFSSILQQRKINFSYILHKFNLFLRDAFKKKENLTRDTLQTFSIYIFLNKLSLLSGEKMENKNNSLKNNNMLDYSIFSNNERKHAFLVGALANYILFIQRSERGNEPFRSKLNNLIIDQNRLRNIFVECVEKLNQYGKSIPSWLPKNFDKILSTPEKWNSSTDEISYFFTLGLAFGNLLFKEKKQNNNEGDEDGGE